jgi:hypothetical protein
MPKATKLSKQESRAQRVAQTSAIKVDLVASRVQRRQRQRELVELRYTALGLGSNWSNISMLRTMMSAMCSNLLGSMLCCGLCGRVFLGRENEANAFKLVQPIGGSTVPLYALSNAIMARYTQVGEKWVVCRPCVAKQDRCLHTLPLHVPEYSRLVLSNHPWYNQLLSFVDVHFEVTRRANGFMLLQPSPNCILEGPLINLNSDLDVCYTTIPDSVRALLAENMEHNPLFKEFRTMLEVSNRAGIPILQSSVINDIIGNHKARGQISTMRHGPAQQAYLTTFILTEPDRTSKSAIYHAGEVTLRSLNLQPQRILVVGHDGVGKSTILAALTLEAALFPFLFPHGTGYFQKGALFSNYMLCRTQAMFSLFTLYKPYLLMMYQIKQATALATSMKTICLEKDVARYLRDHPGTSEAEAIKHCCQHSMPPTITGMPAWYRVKLKELLCMVEAFGLPHLFVTFTSDEVSRTRWSEIDDLEAFLTKFNTAFTWRDAPVEVAAIFTQRFKQFMKKFIVGEGSMNLLGRVEHYMVRYECQHRESLHVHMVLWLHNEDVERVSNDISAAVPAA